VNLWTWLPILGLLLVAIRGWDFVRGAFKIWHDLEPRKWTRFASRGRGYGIARRALARSLDALWFFPCFCVWMGALACIGATRMGTVSDWGRLPLHGLVVGLVVVNILVCAEACLSFIRLGRWGWAYHRLPVGGEFPGAIGVAFTALVSSVSLYFVVGTSDPSLLSPDPLPSRIHALGLSVFQSVMTLSQASPPEALSPLAQVAVACTTLTGLAFLAVLLALVVGAVGVKPIARTTRIAPIDVDGQIESSGQARAPISTVRAVIGLVAALVALHLLSKGEGRRRGAQS
jgi:hypothetical protein